MRLHKILIGFFLMKLITSCAKLPQESTYPISRIETGAGPEDMVMDSLTDNKIPRLLISCSSRRKKEVPHGEIWSLNLRSQKTHSMKRIGEPENYPFHPHGIDITRNSDGIVTLWVINHMDIWNRQAIIQYIVKDSVLEWVQTFEHKTLTSPNDVCGLSDGGFFWTNDGAKRNSAISEAMFGVKGGYVGQMTSDRNWKKSRKRFGYTNGIGVLKNDLYISTVTQSKVFRYAGSDIISNANELGRIKGGDNLTFTPKGNLLVTAHLNQLKFIKHVSKSKHKSPTAVFWLNPESKEKRVIYYNKGEDISAGSTAIYYNGFLYICQVFDPFIVKVKIPELE